jgi:hypothetical protein
MTSIPSGASSRRNSRSLPGFPDARTRRGIDLHGFVGAGAAHLCTAARCCAINSRIPRSASATSVSISSRENGAPSAVPWTSTKPPGARHHDVHVGVASRVFGVIQIEHWRAADHANRHRCDKIVGARHGRRDRCARHQPSASASATQGAGNRRAAGSAVRLQDVAIDLDRALAKRREIRYRAQASSDQAVVFPACARLSAVGCLAARPRNWLRAAAFRTRR